MNNKQTESEVHSPHYLKKRKIMIVYPLLVIPFVTMIFWALGGGKGDNSQIKLESTGLNMQLPSAHLRDDKADSKLSFYEEAEKDSLGTGSDITADQFLSFKDTGDITSFPRNSNGLDAAGSLPAAGYNDPNEEKVYRKLAELNQQLHSSSTTQSGNKDELSPVDNTALSNNTNDVEKLDQMMKNLNINDTQEDPEMKSLNGMMDKILDIQHPERVAAKSQQNNLPHQQTILPVITEPSRTSISLLDTVAKNYLAEDGFFGLDNEKTTRAGNAIEAVVHETQTLVNGGVIKLRLLSDIIINENPIPRGSFVFGIVSLNGERLEVEVTSIKNGYSLYPVKLAVYDMDGLPGIYVPGAITGDVAKESIDNATQVMELSSIDPSVKAQATSAGINAVKALLSKKIKLVKVTVKAGYKVLVK